VAKNLLDNFNPLDSFNPSENKSSLDDFNPLDSFNPNDITVKAPTSILGVPVLDGPGNGPIETKSKNAQPVNISEVEIPKFQDVSKVDIPASVVAEPATTSIKSDVLDDFSPFPDTYMAGTKIPTYKNIEQNNQSKTIFPENAPIEIAVPQPEKEKQDNIIGSSAKAFNAGSAAVLRGLARTPALAASVVATGSNIINSGINKAMGADIFRTDLKAAPETYDNFVTQYLDNVARRDSYVQKEFGSKDISLTDLLKRRQIGDAAKWLYFSTVEQVPQLALIGAGKMAGISDAAGLVGLSASSGAEQITDYWKKLERGESVPSQTVATMASLVNGSFEGLFEKMGSFAILDRMTNALKGVGKKEIQEGVFPALKTIFKEMFKSGGQEFAEEAGTAVAQGIVDKTTGMRPDLTWSQITKEAFENGMVGLTSGGVPGAVTGMAINVNENEKNKRAAIVDALKKTNPEMVDQLLKSQEDITFDKLLNKEIPTQQNTKRSGSEIYRNLVPEVQGATIEQGGVSEKPPETPTASTETAPPPEIPPATTTGQTGPAEKPSRLPKKSDITLQEFDALPAEDRQRIHEQNDVTGRPGLAAFNRVLKTRTNNYTAPTYVAVGDVNGFKVYNDMLLGSQATDELNGKMFDIFEKHLGKDMNSNIHGDEHMAFGDSPEALRDKLAAASKEIAETLAIKMDDGKIYRPTMKWKIGKVQTREGAGALNAKDLDNDMIGFDKSLGKIYTSIRAANVPENELVTRKLIEAKPEEKKNENNIPDTGVGTGTPGEQGKENKTVSPDTRVGEAATKPVQPVVPNQPEPKVKKEKAPPPPPQTPEPTPTNPTLIAKRKKLIETQKNVATAGDNDLFEAKKVADQYLSQVTAKDPQAQAAAKAVIDEIYDRGFEYRGGKYEQVEKLGVRKLARQLEAEDRVMREPESAYSSLSTQNGFEIIKDGLLNNIPTKFKNKPKYKYTINTPADVVAKKKKMLETDFVNDFFGVNPKYEYYDYEKQIIRPLDTLKSKRTGLDQYAEESNLDAEKIKDAMDAAIEGYYIKKGYSEGVSKGEANRESKKKDYVERARKQIEQEDAYSKYEEEQQRKNEEAIPFSRWYENKLLTNVSNKSILGKEAKDENKPVSTKAPSQKQPGTSESGKATTEELRPRDRGRAVELPVARWERPGDAQESFRNLIDELQKEPGGRNITDDDVQVVETPADVSDALSTLRDVLPVHRVMVVRTKASVPGFDGVFLKKTGTLVFNENMKKPILWVALHEIKHKIDIDFPSVAKHFNDFFNSQLTPEGRAARRKRALAEISGVHVNDYDRLSTQQKLDAEGRLTSALEDKIGIGELASDFMADSFNYDSKFLTYLSKKNPGLFKKVIKSFMDLLTKIINKFKGSPRVTKTEWFKDMGAMRKALARMVVNVGDKVRFENAAKEYDSIVDEFLSMVKEDFEKRNIQWSRGQADLFGEVESPEKIAIEKFKREKSEKEAATRNPEVMALPIFNKNETARAAEAQQSLFSRSEKFKPVDTESPEFKKWFGDSKVVDENGYPLKVYHGTTHKFTIFSKDRGNMGNHYGRAYYFTDSKLDAEQNYSGIGPDLTHRIDLRTERLFDEIVGDKPPKYGTKEYNAMMRKAKKLATKELSGGKETLIEAYVSLKNPVVLVGENQTRFEMTFDDDTGEEGGSALELYAALDRTAAVFGINGQDVWNAISEKLDLSDFTAKEFEDAMRASETVSYIEDRDTGDLAGNEFISTLWNNVGFDGIIMDADEAFGNRRAIGKKMMMDEGTKHYIAFSPTQIKSAISNTGEFDATNPDIRFSRTSQNEIDKKIEEVFSEAPRKPADDTKINVPQSVNDDVQHRMRMAKGIKPPPFYKNIEPALVKIAQAFTRHYTGLGKEDAAVADILRQFEAVPEYSQAISMNLMHKITDGLGKNGYDLFSKAIILPDLVKDIDRGLYEGKDALPFGYKNRAEIQTDIDNVQAEVKKNPTVEAAIKMRQEINRAIKEDLVKYGLLKKDVLEDEAYFHHQVHDKIAERGFFGIGASSSDVRAHKAGFMRGRTGSVLDYNTEYLESEGEVLAQAISRIETLRTLKRLKPLVDISDKLQAQAKTEKKPIEAVIPEGYTQWSPKENTPFYPAKTIPEELIDALLNNVDVGPITEDDVKTVITMGRKAQWIVKEGVAETLDNLKPPKSTGPMGKFGDALQYVNNKWKQWTLLMPLRIAKYNLNNMSGDLDIVLAYNPSILKGFIPAARDAWRLIVKKESPNEEMLGLIKRGVIGSGFATQEVPDISFVNMFRALTGKKPGVGGRIKQAAGWNLGKTITEWRESILRIAAYRHFKAQIEAGKTVYGASKADEVNQVESTEDKAAKMARELLGDYGNLSAAGQALRSKLMPFWSWMEINAPRYMRLIKNAHKEGRSGFKSGAVAGSLKTAKVILAANILFAMVTLWNKMFFPDEEEELGDSNRQLHLILGKNDDGTIRTLRVQGAMSDVLNWAALEDYPDDIMDLANKKSTIGEKAKEAGISTLSKLFNGIGPQYKTPLEMYGKTKRYPTIDKPRPVRDVYEHLAGVLSVDKPYRLIAGKPTKGIAAEGEGALIYKSIPGEAAYYDMLNKARKFLDQKTEGEKISITPTEKANDLYYYKQAIRFGDMKAAKKYRDRYKAKGGDYSSMIQSFERMGPMSAYSGENAQYIDEFEKSLTPKEFDKLNRAQAWYEQFRDAALNDPGWEE
jgi:hypothetical protein